MQTDTRRVDTTDQRCVLVAADSKEGPVHIFQGGRLFCGIRRDELVFGWAEVSHFSKPGNHPCEECIDNARYWTSGALAIEQAEQWVDQMLAERREAFIAEKTSEFMNRRHPEEVEWVERQIDAVGEGGYLLAGAPR